jgi:Family of unknown function (DUF6262)
MTNEAATAALLRYNADRSEQKRRAVQTALAEIAEDPSQPINKSAVARRAGVSREFINSHPELGRLIESAARQSRHTPLPPHSDDATVRGLQAQNRTFAQQISQQKALISELRTTIEELRRQRQLHLGAQLMASAVDPNTHAQLHLDHDRLVADGAAKARAENAALQRRLDEHDRLIAVLQEDLAASRHAHADDIARLTADTTSPVVVIRQQP